MYCWEGGGWDQAVLQELVLLWQLALYGLSLSGGYATVQILLWILVVS